MKQKKTVRIIIIIIMIIVNKMEILKKKILNGLNFPRKL